MKKLLLLATVISSLSIADCPADTNSSAANSNLMPSPRSQSNNDLSGRLSVGVILGEPTGVSVKYFMNDAWAIDGALGWSFRDETAPYLHSDLLWHKFDLFSVPRGQLPLYFGLGGWGKFGDEPENSAGLRFPLGVSYIFDDLPLDIFAEIAPILELTPSTRGGFTAAVGARWWF